MQPLTEPPPASSAPAASAATSGAGLTIPGQAEKVSNILPEYVKQLPESPNLSGVVVSPDGSRVYALVNSPTIDVGALGNEYVRPVADIAAAILTLILLVLIWRAARRRVNVNSRYCVRCDYDLTTLLHHDRPPTHCPECGADLSQRRPVAGQRLIRRTLGLVVLLALVMSAYGWYVWKGSHWYPRPIPEGRWASTALYEYGTAHGVAWPPRVEADGDLLLEIDASTGATSRSIAQRPSRTFWDLTYNPLAKGVYLKSGDGVDLVAVEDGRVIAHLPDADGTPGFPLAIGHAAEPSRVYLDLVSAPTGEAQLVEWNWSDGARTQLAAVARPPGTRIHGDRHFASIPAAPRGFLHYGKFQEPGMISAGLSVVLLGEQRGPLSETKLRDLNEDAIPAITSDGSTLFALGKGGFGVCGFSLPSLAETATFSGGTFAGARSVALRPDGIMAVPGENGIMIRDVGAKKWVLMLTYSPTEYAPRSFSFSQDGLTLAAVMQSGGVSGGPANVTFKLGVWKLPAFLAMKAGAPLPATK